LLCLALSNIETVEVCEHPGSNKEGEFAGSPDDARPRKLFRAETDVEYYDRESTSSQEQIGVHDCVAQRSISCQPASAASDREPPIKE
jgi:hypothetical protein